MKTRGIRSQILMFVIIPVVFFSFSIFIFHIYFSIGKSTKDIEAQIKNDVINFSRIASERFESITRSVDEVSSNYSNTGFKKSAEILLKRIGFLENVFFLDNANKKIISFDEEKFNACEYERFFSYFHLDDFNGSEDLSFWGRLMIMDPVRQKLVYIRSVGPSEYLGVIIDGDAIVHWLLDKDIYSGEIVGMHFWKFHIFNESGDYLYTSSRPAKRFFHKNIKETGKVYGISNWGKDLKKLINEGKVVSYRVWASSEDYREEYWVFGAPIKSMGWWLQTSVSRSDALREVYSAAMVDAFIVLALLIVVFCGVYIVSNKVTKPIRELKKVVEDFVDHREIINLPDCSSGYEVYKLATSFSKLATWLNSRDTEIQRERANNMGYVVKNIRGHYFYFQVNKACKLIFVSPSVASVLGFDVDEFSMGFFDKILEVEGRSVFSGSVKTVFHNECEEIIDLKFKDREGRVKCIELFFYLCRGIGVHGDFVEIMANDVTDRVNDVERFKLLIASAPDAVVIVNDDYIISIVNNKVGKMFGFKDSELINMPVAILMKGVLPDDYMGFLNVLDINDVKCHEVHDLQIFGIKKCGSVFPIEISSAVIRSGNEILVSIIIRDVSERKLIEKELRMEKERAEESDRAKTLFLSSMSHEFRTPLNGVLGYSQILMKDSLLTVMQRNKVRSIDDCGRHLLKLVNDTLDIARMENGQVDVTCKPFNLNFFVDDVRSIVFNEIKEKGLGFKVNVCEKSPVYISSDKLKIKQVLINLLTNAIKFTENGLIILKVSYNLNNLYFSVVDTGIGVSSKDQEKLFIAFSQLESGRKQGGAGLGLAICYKLVNLLGGELTMQSEVGNGSCFSFSIPCVIPTAMNEESSKVLHVEVEDKSCDREEFDSCHFYDPSVSDDNTRFLLKIVYDMLDIGDVDAIYHQAVEWLNAGGFGKYPDILMRFCEEYDISGLELFVKTVSKRGEKNPSLD